MEEIWKNIEDFEGCYQVSNLGRVKSLDRWIIYPSGHKRFYKGKIRILKPDSKGYLRVTLCKNRTYGHTKTIKVHREVAKVFVSNPNNYPQVNHKNGKVNDNFYKNLEWMTNLQNVHHGNLPKLTSDDVLKIRDLRSYGLSIPRIHEELNLPVSKHTLYDVCERRTWKHI